jgi:hypothetical protein
MMLNIGDMVKFWKNGFPSSQGAPLEGKVVRVEFNLSNPKQHRVRIRVGRKYYWKFAVELEQPR